MKRRSKKRARRNPQSWFMAHPWMTFFLAGAVIGIPASIISAMRSTNNPRLGA